MITPLSQLLNERDKLKRGLRTCWENGWKGTYRKVRLQLNEVEKEIDKRTEVPVLDEHKMIIAQLQDAKEILAQVIALLEAANEALHKTNNPPIVLGGETEGL